MRYEVLIQPEAEQDIEEAYCWLAEQSPSRAALWYNLLVDAVLSLETLAARCPIAPESPVFQREIRHLVYGAYRILFTIKGNEVHILHVRHSARDHLKPE